MKKLIVVNAVFALVGFVSATFADLTLELEGGPVAGSDPDIIEVAAPIYTLNGTAEAALDIFTSDVDVAQSLIFTMDNVNSGRVNTIGDVHITQDGVWDATFLANSIYTISSFDKLIVVSFNHTLGKDPMETMLVDGEICDSGSITSRGKMTLLSDYSFSGYMYGKVFAKKNGEVVANYLYDDQFIQEFTNIVVEDQGVWSAAYNVNEIINKKGKPTGTLTGTGTIVVGPQNAPVDTVAQKVSGKKNAKSGIYSWTTTSTSKADAKVKVTIKHTASDLVEDGKNSVSAAAQTRKF
jgi:hypothetical protein